MSRRVTMFQPQFVPQVEARTKRHTIRQKGERTTKVGDLMDAREWTGKPYRSKQRKLLESEITKVEEIRITEADGIFINGIQLDEDQQDDLAMNDGFNGPFVTRQFIRFFSDHYGLPFTGQIIHWK